MELCCSVGLLCGVNVRESVEKLPPQTAVAAPKGVLLYTYVGAQCLHG